MGLYELDFSKKKEGLRMVHSTGPVTMKQYETRAQLPRLRTVRISSAY